MEGQQVQETLVKEIHLRTEDFEKCFTVLQQFSMPLKLGKKMRVVIEYDPQKKTTVFQYFGIEEIQEEIKRLFLYSMEEDIGNVIIRPMSGDGCITIHGAEEAKFFTDQILDYYLPETDQVSGKEVERNVALNITTCYLDEAEKTITLDRQTVSKVCESVIMTIADGLPEEAHTIEVFHHILKQTEDLLDSKILKLK